jgi:hypothetical protein
MHNTTTGADKLRYVILVFIGLIVVVVNGDAGKPVKLVPDAIFALLRHGHTLPDGPTSLPLRLGMSFLCWSRRHLVSPCVPITMATGALWTCCVVFSACMFICEELPCPDHPGIPHRIPLLPAYQWTELVSTVDIDGIRVKAEPVILDHSAEVRAHFLAPVALRKACKLDFIQRTPEVVRSDIMERRASWRGEKVIGKVDKIYPQPLQIRQQPGAWLSLGMIGVEWRSQSIEEVDDLIPRVAAKALACEILFPGPLNDFEVDWLVVGIPR